MQTKSLLFILLLFGLVHIKAQTTIDGSFVHGGITRTYSFYVPASYVTGQPVPLILNLHGYTSNGSQQAMYSNFNAIADTAGFIAVHPDGTIDPNTSQRFWNFGIFGATVNDVGFLEALIDTISAHYSINSNRVYATGMSNGGFMSYALACQTSRFAAVASVTGAMSVVMYNSCNPANPVPVMHIHGTSDSVVPYNGNSTSKGAGDVVSFWVNRNQCNTAPTVTQVPNTNMMDNATAEHYLYSNGMNGHTVEHYKVNSGGHTWPGSSIPSINGNTCRDFNASKEIWRFFSQYGTSGTSSVRSQTLSDLNIYPNPTTGYVTIQAGNLYVTEVTVSDVQGRVVAKQSGENISNINLNYLQAGTYIAKISGKDFSLAKRLVIKQD